MVACPLTLSPRARARTRFIDGRACCGLRPRNRIGVLSVRCAERIVVLACHKRERIARRRCRDRVPHGRILVQSSGDDL